MNGVFFGFLVPVFYIFAMKNPDGSTTEMFYGIHTEIGANLGNSLDINTSWEIATGWMYEDDDYGIMLILQWGIIRFRRKVERRKPKKVLTVWCKKKRKDLTKLFFIRSEDVFAEKPQNAVNWCKNMEIRESWKQTFQHFLPMNKSSDNVNNVSIFYYSETLHICVLVEIAYDSSSTFAKKTKSF